MVIGIVMGIAFAACSPSVKVPEPEVAEQSRSIEGPPLELSAIDSLMWRQPDSALAQLQRFAISPAADSLDEFNGHYCQLLVSELLYKNYKPQSNRDELLQAVDYFDSIVAADEADTHKADKRGASLRERNVFLDARAHYINGAGYYERGEVVNGCAEYLKALEVMEEQFEEKALTGKKAVFMFYIYNRLLELFSAQFMMDPALTCGENALAYCRKVPSLSKEIPNTYFHIGKQYDKKGEKDVAKSYYKKAIEEMPDTNSTIYRDAVSMKALCDYQLGLGAEQSLKTMKHSLASVKDERERVARFLVIGSVYSEEGIYDSALRYFEFAFKNETDATSKIRAAESIRVVYDSLGDREKANEFMRYLTDHKESEGENKALVSKLEDLFKTYTIQKQEKEAEAKRKTAIKKVLEVIIPIAAVLALIIIVLAKLRSKKLLKKQQDKTKKEAEQTHKRHASELEAERVAYQKEQEALRQSLRQREAQVNALETALVQQREEAERRREAFLKEPICQRILGQVRSKPITTRENAFELGVALKDEDFEQLRAAVEKHYPGFDHVLLSHCPSLKQGLISLCHLHLLGINESEIAVLKNVSYSAIKKQNDSLQEKLGIKDSVSKYVFGVAEGLVGHAYDVLKRDSLREMQESPQKSSQKNSQKNSQKIVDLIKERPEITTAEMAEIIGITRRSIVNITNRLQEEGVIRRVGPDKGGHWEVIG